MKKMYRYEGEYGVLEVDIQGIKVIKKNWIELVKHIGDFQGMELWQAICHHDGHHTEGWALVGPETADFYDTDPRELPEEELTSGYRLPSYMPGHRPEQG